MSVSISFDNVVKKYGNTTIINKLSMVIKEGEFFTLLGPSGCGKTTLLRMVAGFNSIESGQITFDGKVINDIAPSRRNIGMVFQNYALFPHMTVGKNVAFGLKNRKVPSDEIKKRVGDILKTTKIYNLIDRHPEKLSGGQQQRVALARAIVIRPDVLLMDEPLSNLDAKLRVEMRVAIKEIQNEFGITTIYVTHDQEEALAVSDRIAVINNGVIQQTGMPKEIYQRPSNIFVSNFIGRSNVLDAKLEIKEGKSVLRVLGQYDVCMTNLPDCIKNGQDVKVSVRPEEFILGVKGGLEGEIEESIFLGLSMHYFIKIKNGQRIEVIQAVDDGEILPKHTNVLLGLKKKRINVFDKDGKINLTRGE